MSVKRTEVKKNKTKNLIILLISLVIVAAFVICFKTYTYYGGFGTGPCADTNELSKYAMQIEDIEIPEGTRVVALGEATHGNVEFQELKLEVFKVMVEKYGIRSFAIEGDFGGCEAVNRYIHGGEGTDSEAAAKIGFAIYRTQQMADLIGWMREYNETAPEGEDIVFYGFDNQRIKYNCEYLIEAAKRYGVDTAELSEMYEEDDHKTDSETFISEVEEIKAALISAGDENTKDLKYAEILVQGAMEKKISDNRNGYQRSAVRDAYLAENVMWILESEKSRGNEMIFMAAHNGHIAQSGTYGLSGDKSGTLLAKQLGDAYYAIGTGFYCTMDNLPDSNGKRNNRQFFAFDPLAKAAYKCGYDKCCIDFASVPKDSSIGSLINGYMNMGSLGEGYNVIMKVLPSTYREYVCPSKLYDAVIYVPEPTPIEIAERQ